MGLPGALKQNWPVRRQGVPWLRRGHSVAGKAEVVGKGPAQLVSWLLARVVWACLWEGQRLDPWPTPPECPSLTAAQWPVLHAPTLALKPQR